MAAEVSDRLREALERLDQAIDRLDVCVSVAVERPAPPRDDLNAEFINATIAERLDKIIERVEAALSDKKSTGGLNVPQVDISINGRLYGVSCDEGQQARVRELAGMVDERVSALSSGASIGSIGETHILVLAGLTLADELSESRAALEKEERLAAARHTLAQAQPENDEDLLVVTIDHLADRIAVIADRLERA